MRARLHLVVHHTIRNLAHLTKNSQGVWEPILGSRLWLITTELTLRKKRDKKNKKEYIKTRLLF